MEEAYKQINKNETKLNLIFSFVAQLIRIICGLIVPRLIIKHFGSEINGTISSIVQFLSYITLLQTGISGIAKANLYEPLSKNNSQLLGRRMKSISVFFRNIGLLYIPYVIILAVVLPFALKTSFTFEFVCSLVLVLSISAFSEYFFGLPSKVLLQSDNKSYIVFILDSLALIINTLLLVLLILLNCNIIVVKLVSSLVFFLKPLFLFLIVKSKYNIVKVKNQKPEKLENRWNGFIEHFSLFVHNNTDIVLISLFLSTSLASVYSVYAMVMNCLVAIIYCLTNSFNATFGFLFNQEKYDELKVEFRKVANISTFLTILCFSVCLYLITPFIKMYTNSINDIEYVRPVFGLLFIVAQALFCLRAPFTGVALSAGKYKETRRGAIFEAVINIVLSFALIIPLGINGLMIGTLVAMLYRSIKYISYCRKNLIYYSLQDGFSRLVVNVVGAFIGFAFCKGIGLQFNGGLMNWVINALITFACIMLSMILVNIIFNREAFSSLKRNKKVCGNE